MCRPKVAGPLQELTTKIDETQVDLWAIKTSVDTRTKSLLETTTDTREHLHKELGLIIQVETDDEDPSRYHVARTQGQEAEVKAWAERWYCPRTGTGIGMV
jgi:hypothetical protein